jgi:hypothetical protein
MEGKLMAAVPIYVWNGTAWQEVGAPIPASPIKYQASAPTSPSTGDIWIDSDADVTTGSQQFQRFRFVASGGETSISGVDANGATLAYTAGTEIVVLNGSTLVRGQDYTATNGTSITGLSPALVASDVLEVFSFMAFNVANTYTQSQVDGLIGAWASWTPTWTGLTVGNGTYNFAKYKQIGKTVFFAIDFSFGTTTSVAGNPLYLTLPINRSSVWGTGLFSCIFNDTGLASYPGVVNTNGSDASSIILRPINTAGTYGSVGEVTSTVPFTWGSTDRIQVQGSYEGV